MSARLLTQIVSTYHGEARIAAKDKHNERIRAQAEPPIQTFEGPQPLADNAKFDPFIWFSLLVWLRTRKFKTITHRGMLSLIVRETQTLRFLVPADSFRAGRWNRDQCFWVPRLAPVRRRFRKERIERNRIHKTLRAPVWHGEQRPAGVRRVRLETCFPTLAAMARLCKDYGYPRSAALAIRIVGHQPWAVPPPDRQRGGKLVFEDRPGSYRPYIGEQALADPEHPYIPTSPTRRTMVGGGLTEAQVRLGLKKMRTDERTKEALVEIVFRRRSTKKVADEYKLSEDVLYVYASRLRKHIPSENRAA